MPPKRGPTAAPSPDTAAQMLNAVARSRGLVKITRMRGSFGCFSVEHAERGNREYRVPEHQHAFSAEAVGDGSERNKQPGLYQ